MLYSNDERCGGLLYLMEHSSSNRVSDILCDLEVGKLFDLHLSEADLEFT